MPDAEPRARHAHKMALRLAHAFYYAIIQVVAPPMYVTLFIDAEMLMLPRCFRRRYAHVCRRYMPP